MFSTPLNVLRWLGHMLAPPTPQLPVGTVQARIIILSSPARAQPRTAGERRAVGS
jgi:hypothetical protein